MKESIAQEISVDLSTQQTNKSKSNFDFIIQIYMIRHFLSEYATLVLLQ